MGLFVQYSLDVCYMGRVLGDFRGINPSINQVQAGREHQGEGVSKRDSRNYSTSIDGARLPECIKNR